MGFPWHPRAGNTPAPTRRGAQRHLQPLGAVGTNPWGIIPLGRVGTDRGVSPPLWPQMTRAKCQDTPGHAPRATPRAPSLLLAPLPTPTLLGSSQGKRLWGVSKPTERPDQELGPLCCVPGPQMSFPSPTCAVPSPAHLGHELFVLLIQVCRGGHVIPPDPQLALLGKPGRGDRGTRGLGHTDVSRVALPAQPRGGDRGEIP